jgi:hypothetical protein
MSFVRCASAGASSQDVESDELQPEPQSHRVLANNDVVRESAQNEPLYTGLTRRSEHTRERNDFFFEQIERCIDRLSEFFPQTRAFPFVPISGFYCLLSSFFEDSDPSHYRRRSRLSNLFLSSSRSMSFAVPALMERNRRKISLSHSKEASESAGSSRLLTSVYARSARSRSERASISERSLPKLAVSIHISINGGLS